MAREIKFRAWTGKEILTGEQLVLNTHLLISPANGNLINPKDFSQYFRDCILMQFTGLKDKNGKDIYEGDIIKGNNQIRGARKKTIKNDIVVWKEVGWKLETYNGDFKVYPNLDYKELEVIGNIYENGDLLKEINEK